MSLVVDGQRDGGAVAGKQVRAVVGVLHDSHRSHNGLRMDTYGRGAVATPVGGGRDVDVGEVTGRRADGGEHGGEALLCSGRQAGDGDGVVEQGEHR